jgi:hypothetical protein
MNPLFHKLLPFTKVFKLLRFNKFAFFFLFPKYFKNAINLNLIHLKKIALPALKQYRLCFMSSSRLHPSFGSAEMGSIQRPS